MISSFSSLGVDLPSIALIVLHSCVMIQRLHKLSPLLCLFVILVISSFISGRAGEVESLHLRSSRALIFSNISVGTGTGLIRCRPDGMVLCYFKNDLFGSWSEAVFCSACHQSFYCIGPRLLFFRLMLERCCIGLIVTSICKLMIIGRWSGPRFVFICQLVEVIREADSNETSGELGLALPGNLVGESQLRITKLEPDTMLSNL